MILLALVLVYFNEKNNLAPHPDNIGTLRLNFKEWLLIISGSLIVILSFILDCYRCIHVYKGEILDAIAQYVPLHFDWWIFWTGELLILTAIALFYIRAKKLLLLTK